MQLGNSRQQGSAEMTQQVRAVTLYFWTHYSGSYPVATTNAQARISLTPEPIWEQHGTANTAQHGTWAGFPEKSQPRGPGWQPAPKSLAENTKKKVMVDLKFCKILLFRMAQKLGKAEKRSWVGGGIAGFCPWRATNRFPKLWN